MLLIKVNKDFVTIGYRITWLINFILLFVISITFHSCKTAEKTVTDIPPREVVPTQNMLTYQQMEYIGFIHFTVNTYTDKEWGYGDESPSIFNPTKLSTDQWAKTAKDAGMKQLILTAKHHDGFCLWPSKFTEHDVSNSPYKNGAGDIVGEFVNSCREYGLKVGLYLSPWDRNHKDYGTAAYLTYYRNQLEELLTQYGEINEIWFDGANGGDGYYGGANEVRKIDRLTYYNWDSTITYVKSLQPNIKIFSDAGPEIRWVGNENGHAGKTFWTTINSDSLVIGGSDSKYLNKGEPDGNSWIVGQCDVSIRPGWFYHESQDSLVKTPEQILDIYYKSVGRNGLLLLNLPPNKTGLIHPTDVAHLLEFKKMKDEIFKTNLAAGKSVSASNQRMDHSKFSPNHITDGDTETYWSVDEGVQSAELTIDIKSEELIENIVLQEPIRFGQRIEKFSIECFSDNTWKQIAEGTTIGYKRILNVPAISTSKVKVIIEQSKGIPALSSVELY